MAKRKKAPKPEETPVPVRLERASDLLADVTLDLEDLGFSAQARRLHKALDEIDAVKDDFDAVFEGWVWTGDAA